MIELSFATPPMRPVELRLHATKGPSTDTLGAPTSLKGLLSLGVPQVRPLDSEETRADEEMRRFLKAESGKNAYHVVLLRCSFNPSSEGRIVEAVVQVDLAGSDDPRQREPIAWSLEPLRVDSHPPDAENSLKIGGDFKFISAEFTRSVKSHSAEVLIEAHNEFSVNPYWLFRETRAEVLTGSFRLGVVTQSPVGIPVIGAMSVSAKVRKLAIHLFPYIAALDKSPTRSFVIV